MSSVGQRGIGDRSQIRGCNKSRRALRGAVVVQRGGMLEPVERKRFFGEITRTGARCRSLKVARDLTSVGLVHHRRLVVKGSPWEGGATDNIGTRHIAQPLPASPCYPNHVSWRRARRVVAEFSPNRSTSLSSRALLSHSFMGKIEGGRVLVNIFFENGHPSLSLSCLEKLHKSMTRR